MDEFVAHAGVKTTHGYMYFVGRNGNVTRVVNRGDRGNDIPIEEYEKLTPGVVAETGITKENGYIYFIACTVCKEKGKKKCSEPGIHACDIWRRSLVKIEEEPKPVKKPTKKQLAIKQKRAEDYTAAGKENIVRVCCDPEENNPLAILKGCLVLVLDPDKEWAYGSHIKYQGGGTWGEYHVIMKYTLDDDECPNWEIKVGDWLGQNCGEDELVKTASGLDGFSVKKASEMLAIVEEVWSRFVQHTDEETYLCRESVLPGAEDVEGSLWYAEDNFDQDNNMITIDIESVSEPVPGNMVFIS